MNVHEKTAQDAMRALVTKAAAVVASNQTPAAKKAALDAIEAEVKQHQDTLGIHKQARMLASGGEAPQVVGASSFALTGKSFGTAPSLNLDAEQLKALHHAATSKQNLRVETKSAMDLTTSIPSTLSPQIVAFRREPTRVASLFPVQSMPGPAIEYVRHISNTGAAGTVAPGAPKPEITLTTDTVTATARKIAAHIGVVDETLLDFGATSGYLSNELVRAITSTENTQLLSGNGTAPNLQGILTTTGILTRTQGASPETALDTLELAMNDLRVGSSFTEADGLVMNPSDFSALRLAKDSQGRYLLGPATEGEPATLWGKPVVVTTDIAAKTVLVGNFAEGGSVLYRQGITIETQSAGTDWTSNITRFRAETRLALAIYRPSMFVKVTLS